METNALRFLEALGEALNREERLMEKATEAMLTGRGVMVRVVDDRHSVERVQLSRTDTKEG